MAMKAAVARKQVRKPDPGGTREALEASPREAIKWLSEAGTYHLLESLLLEPGSPEEVCQRIADLAETDNRIANCSIFLVDRSGENLFLAATTNPALKKFVGKPTYRMGEGLTGWVARYRQPVLVRDPRDAGELAQLAAPEHGVP